MHKGFLKTSFILAAVSVALGAFAAHGLKKYVGVVELGTFETGVRYQFYHVFALLVTAIVYKEFPHRSTKIAGRLFIVGIILFSGSLYLLTLMQAMGRGNYNWIGAITPFGGLCFISAWLLLFRTAAKKRASPGVPE